MASLSVVAGPTGPVTGLSEPQADSPLADVREAYAYVLACRERLERANAVLANVVADAEQAGHGPRAIAAEMVDADGKPVTRQYVQKLLRQFWAAEAEAEAREAELEKRSKEHGRLSGWKENPQCKKCFTLLKRPDAICPKCGYCGGGYLGVPAQTSYLERWR